MGKSLKPLVEQMLSTCFYPALKVKNPGIFRVKTIQVTIEIETQIVMVTHMLQVGAMIISTAEKMNRW